MQLHPDLYTAIRKRQHSLTIFALATKILEQVTRLSCISPRNREGCSSEQIHVGAQKSDKTGQNYKVEDFLAGLRFEQRGILEELPFKP